MVVILQLWDFGKVISVAGYFIDDGRFGIVDRMVSYPFTLVLPRTR